MAENETEETQNNTEEIKEAVATQSPSTDQGIDDPPTASEELSEDTAEEANAAKTEESDQAASEESAKTNSEEFNQAVKEEEKETESEEVSEEEEEEEEISYHAVEKEGNITAIWEMQGAKHIRTISPRSREGQKILNLFTSEIYETDSPPLAAEAANE